MKSVVAILATTLFILSPVPLIQAQLSQMQELQNEYLQLWDEKRILTIVQSLQEQVKNLRKENQELRTVILTEGRTTSLSPSTARHLKKQRKPQDGVEQYNQKYQRVAATR